MNSSPIISAERQPHSDRRPIAPAWHTAIVLIVLLGISLAGALRADRTLQTHPQARVRTYLLTIAIEWILVAFIWYGVRSRGMRVSDLVGGRWARAADVLRDLGIAIGFLIVSGLVLNGIGHLLKASTNDAIRRVLPHNSLEIGLWVLLSLTAGFCEELIFRGYLQRQFAALTRSIAGGIVLQAIVFGLGHGYQGWKLMLLISIFGAMFGLLAKWRRSLRPGMLAHFLQDGVGGILASHFTR